MKKVNVIENKEKQDKPEDNFLFQFHSKDEFIEMFCYCVNQHKFKNSKNSKCHSISISNQIIKNILTKYFTYHNQLLFDANRCKKKKQPKKLILPKEKRREKRETIT